MPPSASSSSSCQGSPNDALTCLASFLASSSPGTVDSSVHQLGVLHLSAFQQTHSAKFETGGSGGTFLPSLSEVSGDPCRKEATAGLSSSGSPKSESPPTLPCSPNSWFVSRANLVAPFLLPFSFRPPAIPAPRSHSCPHLV